MAKLKHKKEAAAQKLIYKVQDEVARAKRFSRQMKQAAKKAQAQVQLARTDALSTKLQLRALRTSYHQAMQLVAAERAKRKQGEALSKRRVSELVAQFNIERQASKRVASAMEAKTKAIARRNLQAQKAKLQAEEQLLITKARKEEERKMVLAQAKTAEVAAAQLIRAKKKIQVARARVAQQLTGQALGRSREAISQKSSTGDTAAHINLTYLGCFSDRPRQRDLKMQMANSVSGPMQCALMCRKVGATFAALQYGHKCFCGKSYGSHGREPPSTCFMKCHSDQSQRCGGVYRNSVYQISH